jgi:Cdc6-like AAA superfamily ATPase
MLIYTSKLSQAIKDGMESIRKQIPTIQSGLDTIRQDHSDARHDKLIAWLSPTNFPAMQSDLIARRQEGTGQWFLHAPKVTKWLNEPNKTLFSAGIPGAGKTMIVATVIDHLLKSVQSSAVGVAYVYCDYKAQVAQDAASLLAALLKQLVQAQPSISEPVEQLYEQHANQESKRTADDIFRALQSVLGNFSTVFIVVDALDEWRDVDGTRRWALAQLRSLQGRTDLRLMFTSRFIPDIVDEFQEALTLEVQASDGDVRHFVAGQMYRLARCIQCDTALQDMVQDKIAEAVDGM